MRLILVLLACIICAGSAVAAEKPLVLLKKPPTYKQGDTPPAGFVGRLVAHGVGVLNIIQSAGLEEGRLLVFTSFVLGQVTVRTMRVDPKTQRVVPEKGEGALATEQCSAAKYPIVLGKTISCRQKIAFAGKEVEVREKTTFTITERDKAGRPTYYCSLTEAVRGNILQPIRRCYSGDGKWLGEVVFFAPTKLQTM